ncbi:hypothetical protein [Allonocardiopsis opalescens]|uniref:Uncharacterized protein n=1 Tax=Allonocardiopsis opalescens TaxID=1144618 RepID=A0A2T0Q7R8_9ACTN|nr:hypothetical protein [Allonocardiopsis opalescens]PRX99900.1 hypothetical protein CLV72_103507 [Allonocardiopsis opalescens]
MNPHDPHVHVRSDVIGADAAARDMMAATFGLVGELPSIVGTGCGLRVPYAATSPNPDRVTCLACREHGRAEHLRLAEQVERLSRMPGSVIGAAEAAAAASGHRERAERFAEPPG